MTWTENWFKVEEHRFHASLERKMFLATDEAAVIDEAFEKF